MKPFERTEPHVLSLPINERISFYQRMLKENGMDSSRNNAKKFCKEFTDELRSADMYQNDTYTVLVYDNEAADSMVHVDEFKGRCTYLSVRRTDREPIHNWEDLFEIKEYFCMGRWAMEIYPPRTHLINAANQYHIIVMPPGYGIPFGFTARAGDDVMDEVMRVKE